MNEQRIKFTGSLDMVTAPELLERARTGGTDCPVLVLDLGDMEFVDSTGVNSLIQLKQQATAAGRSLRLVGLQPDILAIFDILGVRELLCEQN